MNVYDAVMCDEAATSSEPEIRDRSATALIILFVAFIAANWIAALSCPDSDDSLGIFMVAFYGAFVIQPILLGVWTALGRGSLLTRFPMAVPCPLLWMIVPRFTPDAFSRVRPYEFQSFVGAAYETFVVTTLLFLLWRRFTKCRILPQSASNTPSTGVRFSMTWMLLLMTACAVALGTTSHIEFDNATPAFFGPSLFVWIVLISYTALSAAILPTTAIPLIMLYGRPSRTVVIWCVMFWLVVVVAFCLIFKDEGNSKGEPLGTILLGQLGAIVVGAVSALVLRWGGLRLIKIDQRAGASPPPPPEPSPSNQ